MKKYSLKIRMRCTYIALAGIFAAFSLVSPAVAAPNLGFGGDGLATKIAGTAGYDAQNADTALSSTVGKVINVVLSIVGTLFLGLMVYGGVVWMISRSDETEVKKAKETIKGAVIGLAITLAAYAISNFVVNSLLKATEGTPIGTSVSSSSSCQGLPEDRCLVTSGCEWNPGGGKCQVRSAAWGGPGAAAGANEPAPAGFGGAPAGGGAGAAMKTCLTVGGECVDPNLVGLMGAMILPDGSCLAGKTCVAKGHKKQCETSEAPFTVCVLKDMVGGKKPYINAYCSSASFVCVSD